MRNVYVEAAEWFADEVKHSVRPNLKRSLVMWEYARLRAEPFGDNAQWKVWVEWCISDAHGSSMKLTRSLDETYLKDVPVSFSVECALRSDESFSEWASDADPGPIAP